MSGSDSETALELNGFLLTGNYEDVRGHFYLRYFGVSQQGAFEVILTNQIPGFYTRVSTK